MHRGKIIVISAPSGCGKSTIINSILKTGEINLVFSVSATNREPRQGEIHGTHYYFLKTEEFKKSIERGEFIEWEEVYPGRYYGTLASEINKKIDEGTNVILDIDVKGAVNVKKLYGKDALTIFIQPPSIEELRRRLENRATDSSEVINIRVGKAQYEMKYAKEFDIVVINDNLNKAIEETASIIKNFISE